MVKLKNTRYPKKDENKAWNSLKAIAITGVQRLIKIAIKRQKKTRINKKER